MKITVPQIATIPGEALFSTQLSSDAKVMLGVIMSGSTSDGCALTNAAIAGKLDMSVPRVRKSINELTEARWIIVEENGKKRNLIVSLKQEEVMPIKQPIDSDVFSKGNLVIDEKKVNYLISIFIEANINPTIKTKAAINRFYGNPYNRWGAQKLVEEHSTKEIETVIGELSKRKREKFCPKPKSFYSLYDKWENVLAFTGAKRGGKIGVIK